MDKLNYIRHYLKHFFNAQSLDNIHSPFIFDFASKIIKSNDTFYAFHAIERERKKLLGSKKIISINDYGAGSKIFNSNERRVSDIAKTSLKPVNQAQFLFKLVNYFKYKKILELGTSLGITSSYLAKPAKNIQLTTIEGDKEIAEIARKTLSNLNLKNVQVIENTFDQALPDILNENTNFDCIFIDGNHQKDATVNYFNKCLNHIHNDSVIIFDDIYWSKGMTEAWEEIKLHPSTKVSIDLFELGLIFFREEQPKQHFKLKLK